MKKLHNKVILKYIEENIGTFHEKRVLCLEKLKLTQVLKRKNPYLFKAKNVETAEQIIRGFMEAHISSNEETIFGDWLEGLAIFINEKVFNGHKSGITGIDLEFSSENIKYIVTIKSGPKWANSSQLKKMLTDFKTAKKTLTTSNSKIHIIAVNGCCYGNDNKPNKGEYFKYCGQQFWHFISGDKNLYTDIIEPLGIDAKSKNENFNRSYTNVLNKFTREFANKFCKKNGEIDWKNLVKFNSENMLDNN